MLLVVQFEIVLLPIVGTASEGFECKCGDSQGL